MIAVDDQLTVGTLIGSFRQGHLLPVSTPAACLTGISWIDLHELPASLFRFAGQFTEELRPGRVTNAFGETMVMHHPVHVQVFDTDHTETVDDLPTFLMGEVIPSEGDTLMDTSHNLTVLASLGRAFRQLRMLALHFGQGLFFLAEKAGVRDLFSIGEGRKRRESDVNPDLGRRFWQTFGFALAREGDIPFAGRGTLESTRFDLALIGRW